MINKNSKQILRRIKIYVLYQCVFAFSLLLSNEVDQDLDNNNNNTIEQKNRNER